MNKAAQQLKSYLLPLARHEYSTFVPCFFIFFLITFIYDILRIVKSSIIVSATSSGAEIIPFLKVWAVIPGAMILTALVIKLSRHYSREKIFYIMLGFFLSFYTIFILLLYPNRHALEAESLAAFIQSLLPSGACGFACMFKHWHLSIFYVLTELWGSILMSMLFWGFTNEITSMEQAPRFYPLYLLGANIAAIFAGIFSTFFSQHVYSEQWAFGNDAWEQALLLYLLSIIICSFVVVLLFRRLHRNSKQPISQIPQIKLSIRECLQTLIKSRHLLLITILVLSYNLIFNLSDVLWENQMKLMFQDNTGDMAYYKSRLSILTGSISVLISLFLSGYLLRRWGWKLAASITPLVITICSLAFFSMLFLKSYPQLLNPINGLFVLLNTSPLGLALFLGSIQVSFSRSCKYTLFDTTKEISFIPLSIGEKRQGKTVIDGVGSRLGKSAGSLSIQVLLLIFSSMQAATPIIAVMILLALGVWFRAIKQLNKTIKLSEKTS